MQINPSATRRYTDADIIKASSREFVLRKHRPSFWQMAVLFLLAFSFIVLSFEHMDSFGGPWAFFVALFIVLGGLWIFTIVLVQRDRDQVMASEFQNALFAAAAGMRNRFCLIVKRDGNVVYFDPGFQKIFPSAFKGGMLSIHELIRNGLITPEDSNRIFAVLEQGVNENIIFMLNDPAGGTSQKMILSIDPLPRPNGFFLLRAREFVEQRSKEGPAPSAIDSAMVQSELWMISQLLDHSMLNMLAMQADGAVSFITHALEAELGYEQGEIASRQVNIRDLASAPDGTSSPLARNANYKGEIVLKKKNGYMLRSYITQQGIYDGDGRLIGYSAVIGQQHGLQDAGAGEKKK